MVQQERVEPIPHDHVGERRARVAHEAHPPLPGDIQQGNRIFDDPVDGNGSSRSVRSGMPPPQAL
jgi:hypothetical protein